MLVSGRRLRWLCAAAAFAGSLGLALAVMPDATGGPERPATADQNTAAAPRVRVVARGLGGTVFVTAPTSEANRVYVVQRNGLVRVLDRGRLQARPFADLRARTNLGGERGLFSIAFSPNYERDRLLYACLTDREGAVTIVELREVGGRATVVRTLLRVPHEDSPYHNGGQLAFGPDGMLYAGLGDGGYRGPQPDPHGNSQNLDVLLGKLIRLAPGTPAPRAEIVAYGLRNPWRFSFDPATRDLVIPDVGWISSEEINVLRAGTTGLVNFGWSTYEGRRQRRRGEAVALNPAGRLIWPVYTYLTGAAGNCSIIGGYVYRRGRVARLRGRYVFGDYCSGRIWSARLAQNRISGLRLEPFRIRGLTSFGVDARGDLYAMSLSGVVYRFVR